MHFLLTQAMDQNYVKFTSDSLIALALNYYTVERGDSVTRAKSAVLLWKSAA